MSLPAAKADIAGDIRRILYDNYNDTDVRFSNDEILEHLNKQEHYRKAELDVLDFEDVLLGMETSGLLRAIAQNFNTRYFRIWAPLAGITCSACGFVSYYSDAEEKKSCFKCGLKL
jgi:hypothetical protein